MTLFVTTYRTVPKEIKISCSRYHEVHEQGIGKIQRYCPFVYSFVPSWLQFWTVLTDFSENISTISVVLVQALTEQPSTCCQQRKQRLMNSTRIKSSGKEKRKTEKIQEDIIQKWKRNEGEKRPSDKEYIFWYSTIQKTIQQYHTYSTVQKVPATH